MNESPKNYFAKSVDCFLHVDSFIKCEKMPFYLATNAKLWSTDQDVPIELQSIVPCAARHLTFPPQKGRSVKINS